MSRHKLVKGLDLEEELGDYDGDDADDEELAPEVKGSTFMDRSKSNTSTNQLALQRI